MVCKLLANRTGSLINLFRAPAYKINKHEEYEQIYFSQYIRINLYDKDFLYSTKARVGKLKFFGVSPGKSVL
jgi:hypothetical protein